MAPRHFSRRVAAAAFFLSSATRVVAGSSATCPSDSPLSCMNTTVVEDLCCFNAPGGQLLQTQFWDTDPVSGPVDSWTIHGLWPDHCDGTYDANCDDSRAYTNISQILEAFDKTDLLSYMQTYWPDYEGDNESFWEHEWGKHGTCVSTLSPSCYTDYEPTQEVPDFFQRTVDLFQALPTYEWLADAGITPSSSATYTSAEIEAALSSQHGYDVTISCSSGALNAVWYHFNVRGSVQTGDFVPAAPDGSKSSCPDTGVQYLPKTSATTTGGTTSTRTATSATATSAPTGTAFSGRGYLDVVVDDSGSQNGCLISRGTWYTTGTCATYTATASGDGFTLHSSRGYCGIVDSAFVCSSSVTADGATVFTASGSSLAGDDGVEWSAASTPSGSQQVDVYPNGDESVGIQIQWQSL